MTQATKAMTAEQQTLRDKIRTAHERIAITLGIAIGVILSSYFFTFGMLIDRDAGGLLWFQIITSVLFVLALFRLKRVAFFLTKLILGFKADYRRALQGMTLADLDTPDSP